MKPIAGSRHTTRNIVASLTAVAALCAVLYGITGVNPFASSTTTTTAPPAPVTSIQLNDGGLPIGDSWVKQTMIGNVDFQQNWAGTSPDYPYGLPLMVIFNRATTDDLCTFGTAVASYANASKHVFVKTAGCHALNDPLTQDNDHVGCYNGASGMYANLVAALNNARNTGTLTAQDTRYLRTQLDHNFNGYNVADACGYTMSENDSRRFAPVTLITK